MITKLNNFTHKSFVGYSNPSDLLFREKNIFFGYNGKGKSSLAIGIKEEFLKDTAKKTEFGVLLKVCNILSHSINGSKNPQEIHQSAKYLMKLIADNDKLHFDNMKN